MNDVAMMMQHLLFGVEPMAAGEATNRLAPDLPCLALMHLDIAARIIIGALRPELVSSPAVPDLFVWQSAFRQRAFARPAVPGNGYTDYILFIDFLRNVDQVAAA